MQKKFTDGGFLQRHRTAILTASLVLFLPPLALIFQITSGEESFCGAWCPRMFWTWRSGMTGVQFFMGFLRSFTGVLLVGGVLASTFFLGRWWCSHLCPIGGCTELGSRIIPRFLKIPFSSVPAAPVRYGYLAVYLLAPAIGIGSLCCNYCNFAAVPRIFGAAFVPADMAYFFRAYGVINLALLIVLGFMAKGGRAYCNFLCPVGAMDALVNRVGMNRGKRFAVDSGKCSGCKACTRVCPVWAIEMDEGKAIIDHLSCFPCGQCGKICPEGAIHYGNNGGCYGTGK